MIRRKNPISRLWRQSILAKEPGAPGTTSSGRRQLPRIVPLTAFVVMSLGSVGCQEHAIVERGIEFLLSSVRADSSWSNTPNRAVSNSALALNSLATEPANQLHRQQLHWQDTADGRTWDDTARTSARITDSSTSQHADTHDSNSTNSANDCVDWLLNRQRNEPNTLTEVSRRRLGIERCTRRTSQHKRNGQRHRRAHSLAPTRNPRATRAHRARRRARRRLVVGTAKRRRRLGHVLSRRRAAATRRKRHRRHRSSLRSARRLATRLANRHRRARQTPLVVHRRAGRARDRDTAGNISNRINRKTAASSLCGSATNINRMKQTRSSARLKCYSPAPSWIGLIQTWRSAPPAGCLPRSTPTAAGDRPARQSITRAQKRQLTRLACATTQCPNSAPSKKLRSQLAHSSPWPIRTRPLPKPSLAASRGSPPPSNKTPTGGPQSSVSR